MTATTTNPGRASEPARRSAASPGPVKLTRRGRLLVFLTALPVVFGTVLVVLIDPSAATEESGTGLGSRVVMVTEGDTLWSVAARRTEDGDDVRDTMTAIERLNAMETRVVYAGQRLRVPTG